MHSLCRIVILLPALLLAPHVLAQPARAPVVQSVDLQVPVAPAAVNIAGTQHLVYELHITNFQPEAVTLERLEILDAEGEALAEFSGDALAARIGRPGVKDAGGARRTLGGGLRAIVYLWLRLEDGDVPARLVHRLDFGKDADGSGSVTGEPVAIGRLEPVVLDPPLRGGSWAAVYDPALERGHRKFIYAVDGRARIPGRFAIDWVRVAPDGSRARGDGARITDSYGYGVEVLAVADAVVADARDDMPEPERIDAARGAMPPENASGNYVVLDLGEGRYAFYEHLAHGSVRVRAGERVASGAAIGRLGNSGSSSAGPHLHFHVADANSALGAEGLPFVFREFEQLGAFESIRAFGEGRAWQATPDDGLRRGEFPGANTVVRFGGQGQSPSD